MTPQNRERRDHPRFSVPFLSLRYKKEGLFSSKNDYTMDQFPIVDLSIGGLRFLSLNPIRTHTFLKMKIYLPDEDKPLTMIGHVRWISSSPTISYRFQLGISFCPPGEKKRSNNLKCFKKIKALEQLYLNKEEKDYIEIPMLRPGK